MPQSAQKPEPVSILQPQTTVNPDRVKQVRHCQVTSRSYHFSLCFSGSNHPHQLNTDDASLVLYWRETTALADRVTAILYRCCQMRPASGVTTTNYFTSIQFSFIYIASVTVGIVSRHPEPDPNKPHDKEKLLRPPADRHLGKEEGEGGKEERRSIHHTSKYINYNGPKNTPGLASALTELHAPPPLRQSTCRFYFGRMLEFTTTNYHNPSYAEPEVRCIGKIKDPGNKMKSI